MIAFITPFWMSGSELVTPGTLAFVRYLWAMRTWLREHTGTYPV
jgi:hypothetical protein